MHVHVCSAYLMGIRFWWLLWLTSWSSVWRTPVASCPSSSTKLLVMIPLHKVLAFGNSKAAFIPQQQQQQSKLSASLVARGAPLYSSTL